MEEEEEVGVLLETPLLLGEEEVEPVLHLVSL
jgi:hypothetical protein